MLQKYSVPEQAQFDNGGQSLTPAYFYDLVKRRALYFLILFVLVMGVGASIIMILPAIYRAEGKILVESQQIPSELVRPTVTALANERIQVIEQRIMTRDNLLALANKFQLFSGRRKQMSGTEMLDFLRARTNIKPTEANFRGRASMTIAFTVGFEHERPEVAMKVANEFVTMILSEDVRVRTNYATETTKFLERESQRLEAELSTVELKLAELKRRQIRSPQGVNELQIVTLKSELVEKAARYSDAHPDMKVIKQKLEALEKASAEPKELEIGMDSLERQQDAIQKNLVTTGQKLSAARLGESLERGQQSERLEIIEQPTLPQKPIKPNRPKYLAMVFVLSLMAGGGLVFVLEVLQSTIHRPADIFGVVDSHLVVSIPYLSTKQELLNRKRKILLAAGVSLMTAFLAVIVALFFLPPLDLLLNKLFVALSM